MAAKMPSGGSQGWLPRKNPDNTQGIPKDSSFKVVGPGHEQVPAPRAPGQQTHKPGSENVGENRPGTVKKSK